MEFTRKEYYRPSSSGEGEIYSQCFIPSGDVKAVVQFAHGMAEHSGRYVPFAEMLAQNGYIVAANDHIGHGNSSMGHPGTMAMKDGGFSFILKDMDSLYDFIEGKLDIKGKYDRVLFGHSMGSIASANYAANYGGLSALILMGTPAQNPMTPLGIKLSGAVVKKKGYDAESGMIMKISGTAVDENHLEKCWLSRDQESIKKYLDDPLIAKNFSASSYEEMFKGLLMWGDKTWEEKVADIPIFILAGAADPIGNMGKGPKSYYDRLIKTSHSKVELKLYDGARHELMHELNSLEVYNDMLEFLNKIYK